MSERVVSRDFADCCSSLCSKRQFRVPNLFGRALRPEERVMSLTLSSVAVSDEDIMVRED